MFTPRHQEKLALCSESPLERIGEVGSSSLPKYLCATSSSTKYGVWHLFHPLQVASPYLQKSKFIDHNLTPCFWPSDKSADSFLPTQAVSSGFLVLLNYLQFNLRVIMVHGTVQGTKKKQRGTHWLLFQLLTCSDTAEVLGVLAWLVFLASCQKQSKKEMKFTGPQLPCKALPLLCLGSSPFPVIFLLQVNLKAITKSTGQE